MIIRDNGQTGTPPGPTAPNPGADYERRQNDPSAEPDAQDRQPKADHNRRLALGLDVDAFAAEAGLSADELRDYEQTWPDHEFDTEVARKVGTALARLEQTPPPTQTAINGPAS